MKSKLLTTVLGLAVFAIPAAVPASQPADVKVVGLAAAAPAPGHFATLLQAPETAGPLTIELVTGYTTLEWINQDPFAL
jgi:hypothetical protein